MVRFDGVTKRFRPPLGREVVALRDVTLAVEPGEVLGVAGPNGAGKSTLINLLLGFTAPSTGRVTVGGEPARRYVERHGVGYLSELMEVNPRWTAAGALVRYARLAGLRGDVARARVSACLAAFELDEHAAKSVKALSKGTLQRVGLAQTVLRDERLLVFDEPTHGLDPVWAPRFRDLVTALRRPDRAMLIASHDLSELERLTDRVVILDRGEIQRVVRPAAAADAPATYRIAFAHGAELAAEVFPGATVARGAGQVEVRVAGVAALNAGLAALLARGALVTTVAPAESALERQFRDAVGAER